jgi:polyhydroxyalkanoate synthesis regulator protein
MFAPFARGQAKAAESDKTPSGGGGDIDELKQKLDEMQRRLDKLGNKE